MIRPSEAIFGFKAPTAPQNYIMHISYLYGLSNSLSTSH